MKRRLSGNVGETCLQHIGWKTPLKGAALEVEMEMGR